MSQSNTSPSSYKQSWPPSQAANVNETHHPLSPESRWALVAAPKLMTQLLKGYAGDVSFRGKNWQKTSIF